GGQNSMHLNAPAPPAIDRLDRYHGAQDPMHQKETGFRARLATAGADAGAGPLAPERSLTRRRTVSHTAKRDVDETWRRQSRFHRGRVDSRPRAVITPP